MPLGGVPDPPEHQRRLPSVPASRNIRYMAFKAFDPRPARPTLHQGRIVERRKQAQKAEPNGVLAGFTRQRAPVDGKQVQLGPFSGLGDKAPERVIMARKDIALCRRRGAAADLQRARVLCRPSFRRHATVIGRAGQPRRRLARGPSGKERARNEDHSDLQAHRHG